MGPEGSIAIVAGIIEERAQKLVAIQFFILAPYVGYEAIAHLTGAEDVEVSFLGMAVTASSLIGMPLLGRAKQRVAREHGGSTRSPPS